MAARDIMPFNVEGGSPFDVTEYPYHDAQQAVIGEPVAINTEGRVQKSAAAGAAVVINAFGGIALAPTPYYINGTLTSKNTRTGAAYTAGASSGDSVSVLLAKPGTRVISRNFATGGAGVAVVPTIANALNEPAGIYNTAGGVCAIDTGVANLGTTNASLRITDVLDANGNSLKDPAYAGNTGVFVVAEVVSSAWTASGAAVNAA